MECSHNYYATGDHCEKCQGSVDHNTEVILVILVFLAAGFFLWRRQVPREVQVDVFSPWSVLKDQMKAQAPILLQMCSSANL